MRLARLTNLLCMVAIKGERTWVKNVRSTTFL